MLRALHSRRSLNYFRLFSSHHHLSMIPHPNPFITLATTTCYVSSSKNLNTNFARFYDSLQIPPPTPSKHDFLKYLTYTAALLYCGTVAFVYYSLPDSVQEKITYYLFSDGPSRPTKKKKKKDEDIHSVSNWSGTHEVHTNIFMHPESLDELERIVQDAHEKKQKIRPVGSGLSPNGIGLEDGGMVNLGLMNKVLEVDKAKKTVRVQAGIRVQELVDELKEYGLTLQNFASIKEQQIGGIIQVGAHGTGIKLPPIDEMIINMKLVTPSKGTIEVSNEKNPELFYLARCGLGGLGVVAEVTIQCGDRLQLVEHTFVSNMKDVKKNHKKFLTENKHVKYLHIPYMDSVVVVRCNPVSWWRGPPKFTPKYSRDEAIQHVRDLYRNSLKERPSFPIESDSDIDVLSFTELRDKLIALDPLNKDHIVKVNHAEADFWKKSEGYRVGWSDEILGFDCGGQQWVSETCFPTGTLSKLSMKDLEFIEKLQELIQKHEIPAPAPIEQRWTSRSKSLMSPASSSREDNIFSWVGIIMYLPTDDPDQRKEITEAFFKYRDLTQSQLWHQYSAYEHWAKIEVPEESEKLRGVQERLWKRFAVDEYNRARNELDPNKVLSNGVVEKLFGFAVKRRPNDIVVKDSFGI